MSWPWPLGLQCHRDYDITALLSLADIVAVQSLSQIPEFWELPDIIPKHPWMSGPKFLLHSLTLTHLPTKPFLSKRLNVPLSLLAKKVGMMPLLNYSHQPAQDKFLFSSTESGRHRPCIPLFLICPDTIPALWNVRTHLQLFLILPNVSNMLCLLLALFLLTALWFWEGATLS